MQMIRQGNDPEPIGILFMLPNGELGVMATADGRTHEMSDGRVVYDLGDCNAPATPRGENFNNAAHWSVDQEGILTRRI